VFSFSSERDQPEQVASLRSFLANVGTPAEFVVVSDGSHGASSIDALRSVHGCVSVVPWDRFVRPDAPQVVWDCAAQNWRGRKLATVVSLPAGGPVLYTDSDILFFPAASELRALSEGSLGPGPRYLRDAGERAFLDPRLLVDPVESENSANAGFFFYPDRLDWQPPLDRLGKLVRGPRTFTDQTVVHLALHQAGARQLDRERYVLATDDRHLAKDPYLRDDTVMRHYVTPVRHKFWLAVSRGASGAGTSTVPATRRRAGG
jgi:hypothetical protein